jgi:hypothetical protein
MHAIANNQRRARLLGAAKESRDIFRPMLAVTIEGHHPDEMLRQRSGHACLECRTFARVSVPPHNPGSRGGGPRSRLVRRTIVHYYDSWQAPPDLQNQPGDSGFLIAARNDNRACHRPVHP